MPTPVSFLTTAYQDLSNTIEPLAGPTSSYNVNSWYKASSDAASPLVNSGPLDMFAYGETSLYFTSLNNSAFLDNTNTKYTKVNLVNNDPASQNFNANLVIYDGSSQAGHSILFTADATYFHTAGHTAFSGVKISGASANPGVSFVRGGSGIIDGRVGARWYVAKSFAIITKGAYGSDHYMIRGRL